MSKIKIKNIRVKNSIGFENDEIFLLSAEEYEKYEDVIPECKTYWWLRTPGYGSNYASCVDYSGDLHYDGDYVINLYRGMRPALKSEIFKEIEKRYSVGTFSFTCIDEGLGIATVPISFDKFDDGLSDYKKSYIRKWLIDWNKKNKYITSYFLAKDYQKNIFECSITNMVDNK